MNNNKKFMVPELEIVLFADEEIIVASGEADFDEDEYGNLP